MARVTNIDFLRSAYAEETGSTLIMLMSLSHPSIDTSILLSTDPTEKVLETSQTVFYGTISREKRFIFLPMLITLPDETEEGPLQMRITLDNVSRELIGFLRGLSSPPSINVELVMSDDVDTVLATWPEFLMTNIRYNEQQIVADLSVETLIYEPFPAGTFTPGEFPGLF